MRNVCFIFTKKRFSKLLLEESEINWDFLDKSSLTDEIKEVCKKIILALKTVGNNEIFSRLICDDGNKCWDDIHLLQIEVGFRIKEIDYFFKIPLDDYFFKEKTFTVDEMIVPMFMVCEWEKFIFLRIKEAYLDEIESQNNIKQYYQKIIQERKEMLLERDGEIDESNYFLFLYNLGLKSANEKISDLEENKKAFFSACGIE